MTGLTGRAPRRVGLSRRARAQAGAATLLVMAMLGVLLLVGGALGVVAALIVDHRSAQAAADLSALAAARTLADGGDPCGVGASVATANGARLLTCEVAASAVTLEVSVRGPRWLGQHHDLVARARAGPAVGFEPARSP